MTLAALAILLLLAGCACVDCYLNPGCHAELQGEPVSHPDCP